MITLENIKNSIIKADTIAVICHVSPDCDTVGAGLALSEFIKKMGKSRVDLYCDDTYTKLNFLSELSPNAEDLFDEYDLAVAVDVATAERMGDMRKHYYRAKDRFVIDHHKSNEFSGVELYLEATASSTCEIMYSVFEYIDKTIIDKKIAELLYAGILTDSGAFYHPTTTEKTHSVLSKLYQYNIDANKIYYELFKKISLPTFKLHTLALSKAKFLKDGQVAVLTFMGKDFIETETDYSSTEGCINKVLDVDGVKIAVSIAEVEQNSYKISFRSKGDLDVSLCASRFGGGGHKNAAGCRLKGDYYDVLDKLIFAIECVL